MLYEVITLWFSEKVEVAFRRSVADYKVSNNTDSIFGIPNEPAVAFEAYNATYNEFKVYYTPAQKYIREPHEKIILGSKWPTFYTVWRKGVPKLFKSRIDFSYLEFGMTVITSYSIHYTKLYEHHLRIHHHQGLRFHHILFEHF